MKENFLKLFLFTGCASLFLSGCLATQEDTQILRLQISELSQILQELQKNQADNAVQMEEIMGRLTQAADNIENFDYKIDNLSAKLDNIEASVQNTDNKSAPVVLPTEIYNQAKKQFENGQYDQALQGFGLYLKATESRGVSAEEAYINIAKIYLEKKDYKSAAITAATAMEKFPKGALAARARLLYAQSLIPLKKIDEAKEYLNSIKQDYPKSPSAKEAKTLLKGLK